MEINILYFIVSSGCALIIIILKMIYKTRCDEIKCCCCSIRNHASLGTIENNEEQKEQKEDDDFNINKDALEDIYKSNINNI